MQYHTIKNVAEQNKLINITGSFRHKNINTDDNPKVQIVINRDIIPLLIFLFFHDINSQANWY